MKNTILPGLVLLFITSTPAIPAIRLVPDEYATIQAAIDDCNEGDVVIVAPGTYSGDGNRDIDLRGKAVTVRSVDPTDPNVVSATIIDCQGSEQEPHRGFYLHSDEGPDSVVAGLTITNGYSDYGGAIYGHEGTMTITNCTIVDNSSDGRGGGLSSCNGAITGCTIENNSADYGGGLSSCRGAITDCTIVNNSADHGGGGLSSCTGAITGCTIVDNSADRGGGLYLWKGTMANCIVAGNTADEGGGFHFCSGATLTNCIIVRNTAKDGAGLSLGEATTITNCTIVDNSADNHGGGLYEFGGTIANCIIWNNNPDQIWDSTIPTYSCISGFAAIISGFGSMKNNIDVNPCFINPGQGNYHLSADSPCISGGDPNYSPIEGQTDIDGQPRLIGRYVDIGADEFLAEGGLLGVLPRRIHFVACEDYGNVYTKSLTIWNDGSGIVDWTITEDCSWLSIDTTHGSSNGQTDETVLSVDITDLSLGQHLCQLTISAPDAVNSLIAVPITLYVRQIGSHLHVPSEYPTIQEGIDAAADGETVIVAPGTYTGVGNRDIDFRGKAITVRSEGGPETCLINCQGSKDEFHRGFYLHSGEDTNSIVQGFTITNGFVRDYNGGGIYCDTSSPRILDCIITGNAARRGGGISCSDSNSLIANCVVYDNKARFSGGGISIGGEHPMVINCVVTGNWASDYGGGIFCGGNPVVANCTICENRGGDWSRGGGVTFSGVHGDKSILHNCILWGNAARYYQQISCEFAGILGAPRIELVHCIVQNGPDAISSWWPVEGKWTSTEPHFANPGYWEPYEPNSVPPYLIDYFLWVQGDYHLKSQAGRWDLNHQAWVQDDVTSPCIDAGNPSTPIGDEPFPNGGIVNIGAYGGTAEASKSYFGESVCRTVVAGDIYGDCKVDWKDFAIMASHWLEDKSP